MRLPQTGTRLVPIDLTKGPELTEINDKAQLDIAAAGDTDAVTSDTPEEP